MTYSLNRQRPDNAHIFVVILPKTNDTSSPLHISLQPSLPSATEPNRSAQSEDWRRAVPITEVWEEWAELEMVYSWAIKIPKSISPVPTAHSDAPPLHCT
jgi:hypothetical protein